MITLNYILDLSKPIDLSIPQEWASVPKTQ